MKTEPPPRAAWMGRFADQFPQWRSLEQLADTPEFREFLEREFPEEASEWPDAMSRRRFLGLMGASLALAGLSACSRQPIEKLVPYVRQPPELTPGKPLYFASADLLSGVARGIVVESHEGRPTKIEGNPRHPGSLGGTDALMQASILRLYDPDRSKTPLRERNVSTWDAFLAESQSLRNQWAKTQGAGLRFLSGQTTSPALLDQIQRFLTQFPAARWTLHEPAVPAHPLQAVADLDRADVILAIDADFLVCGPGQLAYSRQFARRRDPEAGMNRLYVAESFPSLTGAAADHRFSLKPADLARLPGWIEDALSGAPDPDAPSWVAAVVQDLERHAGRGLVLAGDCLSGTAQEAVYRLNDRLGNIGQTLRYQSKWPEPAHPLPLRELVKEMAAGRVETLFILDANPVYTCPADVPFAEAMAKVPLTVHHGLYVDETAARCVWHLPETDSLEAWSDAAAFDG
ncbi:MAG TPA: TAT-variant-translocated molybdopterin oxidoreductase, partial [Chthoniobacterales bacterium]